LTFNPTRISERGHLSRFTDSQSNGIEDARFVEFQRWQPKTYYATYTLTAHGIRSELIETSTSCRFECRRYRYPRAQQGHGAVPARIDGKYAMIALRTMRTYI